MAHLCDGEGRVDCYCQGDHCGCGTAGLRICTGCEACTEPPDLNLESLATLEPAELELDPRRSDYGQRRPMRRESILPATTVGEFEERRGRYGD